MFEFQLGVIEECAKLTLLTKKLVELIVGSGE